MSCWHNHQPIMVTIHVCINPLQNLFCHYFKTLSTQRSSTKSFLGGFYSFFAIFSIAAFLKPILLGSYWNTRTFKWWITLNMSPSHMSASQMFFCRQYIKQTGDDAYDFRRSHGNIPLRPHKTKIDDLEKKDINFTGKENKKHVKTQNCYVWKYRR